MSILIPTIVIALLGLAFGLLLGYAGKKFAVEADERVSAVRSLLPGANCGGCGNPSCDAFASALVSGKANASGCAVNTADNRKAIGALLGMDVKDVEPSIATVLCQGTVENSPAKVVYDGLLTCQAASLTAGGTKSCAQACLGLGDCVRACTFHSISIENGIAKIAPQKCTACGNCVKACPRQVIRILPKKRRARVQCRTRLQARDARGVCQTACIRCQLCVRNCPESAISLVDDLIVVDHDKCTGCGICVGKCPTQAILLGTDA